MPSFRAPRNVKLVRFRNSNCKYWGFTANLDYCYQDAYNHQKEFICQKELINRQRSGVNGRMAFAPG